jgi:hypothetical protein
MKRWGLIIVLVLVGCSTRNAQVATQTALNATAAGVVVARDALAEEVPRLSKLAAAEVWRQCPAPCPDFDVRYETTFEPVAKAIVGVKVAQDALDIAQGVQNTWVASGLLPDTDPLCKGLGDAVAPVPRLLKDAGVKGVPVEVEALAGPGTQIACDVVSGWVKRR